MRLVTDEERGARLGLRHALARSVRADSPEEAARAVVCLHATDLRRYTCREWLDGRRVFTVYPSPAMQPGAGR